jgi:hypothetical protein
MCTETNSAVGTVTLLLALTPRNFGSVLVTVNRIYSSPQHPDCFRNPSLWVSRALPTEVNQPMDEADHIPTSGVEVKRKSTYTIFPPRQYACMMFTGPN